MNCLVLICVYKRRTMFPTSRQPSSEVWRRPKSPGHGKVFGAFISILCESQDLFVRWLSKLANGKCFNCNCSRQRISRQWIRRHIEGGQSDCRESAAWGLEERRFDCLVLLMDENKPEERFLSSLQHHQLREYLGDFQRLTKRTLIASGFDRSRFVLFFSFVSLSLLMCHCSLNSDCPRLPNNEAIMVTKKLFHWTRKTFQNPQLFH